MSRNRPVRKTSNASSFTPLLQSGIGRAPQTHTRHHAFVNRFILLPRFSPVQAEVEWDNVHSASGFGSRSSDSSAPQPPGLTWAEPGSLSLERPGGFFATLYSKEDLSAFGKCGDLATVSMIGRSRLSRYETVVRRNAPDTHRQFSDVSIAPIIAPGCWELPFWRMTATESTPSNLMAPTGTVNVSLLPFQVPSLIQRRTTLV
jgi:hypothetical protein